MKAPRGIIATVLLVLAGCGEGEPVAVRANQDAQRSLYLEIRAEPLDDGGRLRLTLPLHEPVRIRALLMNRGNKPIQVCRSSYALYAFFHLRIHRIKADGSRTLLPVHPDYYPSDDTMPPTLEYVTLAPGAAIERDMTRQLVEGYLLQAIHGNEQDALYRSLRMDGRGALREEGDYELRATYRTPQAETPERGSRLLDFFDGEAGRAPNVPLAAPDEVTSEPVPVLVHHR